MSEQWEMVTLTAMTLYFYSAKGFRPIKVKDFLRDNCKEKGTVCDAISLILADGWEPFAAKTEGALITDYSFRRKINS